MKIPMKVDYGVRALVELALAYDGGRPTPTAVIAARQSIPEAYLDQLLAALNKSGFVNSRRGPLGGHLLARPPAEISLSMVMAHLDANSSPLDCLINPADCLFSESCAQQEVWKAVEEAILGVLRHITLADLAARQQSLMPAAAAG